MEHNIAAINNMSDNDKIMYVIEKVLNATSEKKAVTMRQVVDTAIKMGITEDYPRGREDGHPWWPHTAVMMGVGNNCWEEFYLHRKKMHKKEGGCAMFYWVDRSHRHNTVAWSDKAEGVKNSKKKVKKIETTVYHKEVRKSFTPKEIEAKMNLYPGMYVIQDEKLYSTKFVVTHPEKFTTATVAMANLMVKMYNIL